MKKSRSVFDYVWGGDLFQKKTEWDDLSEMDKKNFSVYMVNRIISMKMDYTNIINDLQPYTLGEMTPKMVYELYKEFLPRSKFFAKYIKAKKKKDDVNEKLVEFMANVKEWSLEESRQNLKLILKSNSGSQKLEKFLSLYGLDDKQMKKFGIK